MVAMPGLVKIGRSRKEDIDNASTATTHKLGYVCPAGSEVAPSAGLGVYVNLRPQYSSISSDKQAENDSGTHARCVAGPSVDMTEEFPYLYRHGVRNLHLDQMLHS